MMSHYSGAPLTDIQDFSRLDHALALAAMGLKLFPIKPNDKKPTHKGWRNEGTDDPAQLRKWFGGKRDFNIGVDAERSGLVVIDPDRHHDDIDGLANFIELEGGIEPDTFTVATPSGGRHLYFRGGPVKGTASVLAPGVDVKSRGGYVLGPGSVFDGKPYRVVNSARIADVPEWLSDAIAEKYTAKAEPRQAPSGVAADDPKELNRARDYLASIAPPAIEGNGGDDTTVATAAQLHDLAVSENLAVDLMAEYYNPRCVPPWEPEELAAKVASGYKSAQNTFGCDTIAAQFDILPDDPEPANDNAKPRITATPFIWRDPALIRPREWLFGRHYIRRYVTGTVAPGGTGKTSMVQTEILAMATGLDLIGGNESPTSLKVWLWNLEDPTEEVERRFAAAVIHHGIDPAKLDGQLFVNSGRDTPLVIARKVRDAVSVSEPVISDLVADIRAKGIDVLVIDPFVSSHSLPENDNAAIDAAVKAWGRVAHLGNCAVELVHHSRKLNGEAVSADSARGGSAFVDGCRGVRVINRMTEAEAAKLGVTTPRLFFGMIDDKPNMAPPADKRDWYQLVSVRLPNGEDVAAVDTFTPPDPLDDLMPEHLSRVQALFTDSDYRESDQSPDWGGHAVASVLALDIGGDRSAKNRTPQQKAARAKVKIVLTKWRDAGVITTEERRDRNRDKRHFFASGKSAAPAAPLSAAA